MKKEEFLKKLEKRKTKSNRGQGRIAVLSNKELILAALERGYNLKDIFSELKELGQMPVSYSTFARTVAKYLTAKAETRKTDKERVGKEKEIIIGRVEKRKKKAKSTSKEKLPAERTGEIYRPAEINVDDLIIKSE